MKTICIDFDGVIHHYNSGWKGVTVIPDEPVHGAFEWLKMLLDHPDMKPVIYSSRSKDEGGIAAMQEWFVQHGFERIEELEFPTQKPAAFITIDDRAFCFQGRFPTLDWINEFKPWTVLEKEGM